MRSLQVSWVDLNPPRRRKSHGVLQPRATTVALRRTQLCGQPVAGNGSKAPCRQANQICRRSRPLEAQITIVAAGKVEALDPRCLMVDEQLYYGTVCVDMDIEVFVFSQLK